MKLNDKQMIYLGQAIIIFGIIILLLSLNHSFSLVGLVLTGLGCAPIYPCLIHSTPSHFGTDTSQAVIGVQMASAYVGTCLMPPLFGFIANRISIAVLPVYLFIFLTIMVYMFSRLIVRTEGGAKCYRIKCYNNSCKNNSKNSTWRIYQYSQENTNKL